MVKKVAILAVIVMLIVGVFFFMKGPDLSKYEYLKEPQITSMPNQKMLVVETKGDPNVTCGAAFSQLYKTFYQLKKNIKGLKTSAPRARWLASNYVPKFKPKEEWIGIYGVPIIDSVDKLPDESKDVKITTWEYGTVAEILHMGPYSEETPTIEKLQSFIKSSGYKIAGDHEEEYLKGPGMLFKGNPKKYYTIIRYQIKKK